MEDEYRTLLLRYMARHHVVDETGMVEVSVLQTYDVMGFMEAVRYCRNLERIDRRKYGKENSRTNAAQAQGAIVPAKEKETQNNVA